MPSLQQYASMCTLDAHPKLTHKPAFPEACTQARQMHMPRHSCTQRHTQPAPSHTKALRPGSCTPCLFQQLLCVATQKRQHFLSTCSYVEGFKACHKTVHVFSCSIRTTQGSAGQLRRSPSLCHNDTAVHTPLIQHWVSTTCCRRHPVVCVVP